MCPLRFGLVSMAGLNDRYNPKSPPSTADRIPARSIPRRISFPAYSTSASPTAGRAFGELTSCRYHLDSRVSTLAELITPSLSLTSRPGSLERSRTTPDDPLVQRSGTLARDIGASRGTGVERCEVGTCAAGTSQRFRWLCVFGLELGEFFCHLVISADLSARFLVRCLSAMTALNAHLWLMVLFDVQAMDS